MHPTWGVLDATGMWKTPGVPRLSVLIPARNASATVGSALRSTLRALPDDAEIVVLDDASTDDTAAAVSGLGDPRIRLISSDVNLGVAGGLARLLDETSSEFVARMDADDVCLPGRFRIQSAAISRGADLIFSTFQAFGSDQREPRLPLLHRPALPVTYDAEASRLALLLFCPAHSTLLARRSTLVEAGGYRAAATEDYDLWLRVAARGGRIVRLGRPTILLRASPGQVTAQDGWTERVASDPMIADSYAGLVESVWATRETPWLSELSMMRSRPLTPDGRTVLEPFVQRFIASLAGLPPTARWALTRRARQELGWRAGR